MKLYFSKIVGALALTTVIVSAVPFMGPAAHAQSNSQSPVTLTSDVKIERVETDAAGKDKVTLYTPKDVSVVPGDKVIFILEVSNTGAAPAVGFRATNPMPGAVQFTSVAEDWAEVSVDGGTNWGKLPMLKVKAKDASGTAEVERPATAEDVTHVRWIFADAIAPGAKRNISYRGVVK